MDLCSDPISYLCINKISLMITIQLQKNVFMYNYMQEMKCINELRENETDENLRNCVVAFQGHTFHTYSGLEFSYTLKS